MSSFEFGEKLSDWLEFSVLFIFEALADAFPGVGPSGNIEQPLVGFCVLNNRCSLSIHGENDWTLALFEVLHEFA